MIKTILEDMYTDGVSSVNFRWGEGNVIAFGEFTDRTTVKGKKVTKVMEFTLRDPSASVPLEYKLISMLDTKGNEVEFQEGVESDDLCEVDFSEPLSERERLIELERRLNAIAATAH